MNWWRREDLNPPEDVERIGTKFQFLKSQGYIHYEISNFAIPGKECRHNPLYWQNKEYIGLGAELILFAGT